MIVRRVASDRLPSSRDLRFSLFYFDSLQVIELILNATSVWRFTP
jgi:hypothetical protein